MRLEGKKVIVTGANRSIGKAIALLFAKEGAELVISYRSDKKGAEETINAFKKQMESQEHCMQIFPPCNGIEQFYKESINILGTCRYLG